METVGDRIRKSRIAVRLTQQDVAMHVGVSRVAVTQWENGTSAPAKDNVQALALILKVPKEWILYGKNAVAEKPDGQLINPMVLRGVIRHIAREYPEIITADPISLAEAIVDLCEYVQDTNKGELSRSESGLAIKRVMVAGD